MPEFKTLNELTEAERLFLEKHHAVGTDPFTEYKTFGVMYNKHGELLKVWGKEYTEEASARIHADFEKAMTQMNALKKLYVRDAQLIPLKQWAENHGISPATARQRAGRGAFETAIKVGRDWFISKDEPLVDHRVKG